MPSDAARPVRPRTAGDLMTADPVQVGIGTSVSDVARLMRDRGIGDVLVVDGETLVGIVTDRDIAVRAVAAGLDPMDSTAGEISTTHPFTVPSSCPLVSAVEQMRSAAVRRVPVVDEGDSWASSRSATWPGPSTPNRPWPRSATRRRRTGRTGEPPMWSDSRARTWDRVGS